MARRVISWGMALMLLFGLSVLTASAEDAESVQVSFLGPAGTYTEEAAQFWFRSGEELLPKETVNDAVADVLSGEAEYAVIPQENTLGGPVTGYLDALIAAEDISVVGRCPYIILFDFSVFLYCRITTVCSHSQGLAQSARWREENLPNAQTREMSSTAAAASFVADQQDKSLAAVAAPGAAALYGLEVLAENVQITDTNKTRFYVLSLRPAEGEDLTHAVFVATCDAERIDDILIALHDTELETVALHDRPEGSRLGMYHYVIEAKNDTGISDTQIRDVCAEEGVRFLGRFRAVDAAAEPTGIRAEEPVQVGLAEAA